jgi:hypothetical protein
MEMDDPAIVDLIELVSAAQKQFDWAVAYHEAWKPMAFDAELHKRMGTSRASNTFKIIRTALRREMVLSLMKLWDSNPDGIRMSKVWTTLRNKHVVRALGVDRAKGVSRPSRYLPDGISGLSDIEDEMCKDIVRKANLVKPMIAKYMAGGSHYGTMKRLTNLRNEHLAHHQVKATSAIVADNIDDEIEEFYNFNSDLIQKLLSLVSGVAYDPDDTAKVHRVYAENFWLPVKGEMSEGHPRFRARRSPPREIKD